MPNSIKSLHIAPIGNNMASGLSYSIPSLLRGIQDIGSETALLTTHPQQSYLDIESFRTTHYKKLGIFPSLERMAFQPNIVIFHSTYIPIHAYFARYCLKHDIPYVITPRGGMTLLAQKVKPHKKQLGNLLFFNKMVKNAAAIHCLTEEEATEVRRWNRPVFIVSNGTTIPELTSEPGTHRDLKFVFIGRLAVHHKGLDLLLEACSLMHNILLLAGVHVFLYGPNNQQDMKLLLGMIQRYGINDIVSVEKAVYGNEKHKVLLNSDAFIHTSRFEGHPTAVLEALSYGLPCLLTDGTNMSTIVEASGSGWRVATDAQSIAEKLHHIIKTKHLLPDMGLSARRLARDKYSWNSICQQTLVEYRNIIRTM